MDDDLLADDGQFKDDGLDELDIDEEAALLGLSDEEIESKRITGDQDLEYVDEDGNPVEIGENNAEQYEVAKYRYDKNRGTPTEDDVLDLDLDAELESFIEDDPDLLRESPVKTFNERQCKDNLISLTSRNERNKPMLKRQDSRRSPDRSMTRGKTENSYSMQSTRKVSIESFNLKVEYDEESEDEEDDDHRERFKSERSNIITLTPAKNRDIPDTLESVISVEETAKVQAFLENEQKRKMRYKGGRNTQQMKTSLRHGRPAQSFPGAQHHQSPQFSAPAPVQQQFEMPPGPPQPQKILINPHFRGPRQLPISEPVVTTNQSPQVSAPQIPYNQPQNFASPVGYSQDHSPQVSVAPPPTYSAPPPLMQYSHPDYPPQQQQHVHIQQNQPPIWQTPPPEMHPPPVSYANPPPHLNYGEPMGHAPVYHSYNPNNFQNAAYSPPQMPPPQMPPPQTMNYNQPPPIVHHHPPSHSQVAFTPAPPTNVTHLHYQNSQPNPQQNIQQKPYQEQRNVNQAPRNVNQVQRNVNQAQRNVNQAQSHNFQRNNAQNQPYNRVSEKRPSNVNMKQVPKKQPRLEHQPRKNIHVNNSNIREIPLVDTVKKEPMVAPIKKEGYKPVVVEEEDEKTKELRMKIEEQKLLREQILKRKEERRRQMAAQRLMDLKKRQQPEQNTNVISVPRVEQKVPVQPPVQADVKPKVSVRERIGVPGSNTGQVVKKKVIVVRKKAVQPVNNAANTQQNRVGISQRLGNQPIKQGQPQKTPVVNTQAKQIKQNPQTAPTTQPTTMKKNLPHKNLATAAAKKIIAKSKPNVKQPNFSQLRQKGNILQRLGNRGNFQRPLFDRPRQGMRPSPSPRFNGPRPPPAFMEHRMRFHGPMNDMRQPFHDQGPSPFDRRPLLFEDRRPPPFEDRRPPPFEDHRPPPFEDQCPPFHDQRSPPFEKQRLPLLPFHLPDDPFHPPDERPPFNQFMLENDHPRFRIQGPGYQDFRPTRMDYPDRFPRPQFQNQMMRPKFDPNNGPMFQRPRFHGSNQRQRFNNQQKKTGMANKTSPGKTAAAPSPAKTTVVIKKEETQDASANLQNTSQQVVSNTPADIKPQSVCVENLSSSTSAMQLKKLCSSVGIVENIQLIKDQRKAVIKFKEPSHAVNFQKKFQRYMLDLAMIQVSLVTT